MRCRSLCLARFVLVHRVVSPSRHPHFQGYREFDVWCRSTCHWRFLDSSAAVGVWIGHTTMYLGKRCRILGALPVSQTYPNRLGENFECASAVSHNVPTEVLGLTLAYMPRGFLGPVRRLLIRLVHL